MTNLELKIHTILATHHGEPYASTKIIEIAGLSSAEVLQWSTIYLDSKNRGAFFRAIGIDDSVATSKILRKCFTAAASANF